MLWILKACITSCPGSELGRPIRHFALERVTLGGSTNSAFCLSLLVAATFDCAFTFGAATGFALRAALGAISLPAASAAALATARVARLVLLLLRLAGAAFAGALPSCSASSTVARVLPALLAAVPFLWLSGPTACAA